MNTRAKLPGLEVYISQNYKSKGPMKGVGNPASLKESPNSVTMYRRDLEVG